MEDNTSNASERLSIQFDGDNSIDAALLGTSILNITQLSHLLVAIDGKPEQYQIRVAPFRKGSFIVDFDVVLKVANSLTLILPSAVALVTIIKYMFEIKKLSRGDKPTVSSTDDNRVTFKFGNGTEVSYPQGTDAIVNDQRIDRLISEISMSSRINNPSGGFTLSTSQGSSYFGLDDIPEMGKAFETIEVSNSDKEREYRVLLPIKSPDLLERSSWKFKYGTRTIPAKIEDNDFLQRMHNKEVSLSSGDSLDATLLITTQLSPVGEVIGERYKVVKVHRVCSPVRGNQVGLFDE